MRTLLTTLNAKYIHINLAIRQLYALTKDVHDVKWKEFTINEPQQPVVEHCAQYDVVAFSCYIWNITPTLLVAEQIKKLNPNCKIMLGGPEVSYEWQEVIALPYIDFIVVGEGEVSFEKFLDNYPNLSEVPSLVRKENGDVYFNPLQEAMDLTRYEHINPYAYDPPQDLYNKVAYLETSRGCPYKCEFCLASLDNKVRYLPTPHIHATLFHLMQHGRVIKFLDRTFNIKRDFTIGMFEYILQHYREGNVFQFEITADIVHPDIIAFIQQQVPKGLFRFEIGIQTVNQKANLEVSRKQNFEKTKDVILQLRDYVEMHLDLIVGLPLDTWQDIKYSIEQVFALHAPELQLGFLKFLKGTPMRHKQAQHQYVYDPMPPYQIISSKYLSSEELAAITVVENALEIYWNKGRCIHTLKYAGEQYSIFDFFLGLGNFFAQHNSFHKYALEDVYLHIYAFAKNNFAHDAVLRELITLDYLLQSKLRPKVLFAEELDKQAVKVMVNKYQLPHHGIRYGVVQLSFALSDFLRSGQIINAVEYAVVRYANFEAPKLLLDWQAVAAS